jgi:DNA polymerase-3 subunit epsilon
LGRSRSRIQRAKSYRWELPEPEATTIDAEGRQRWDEARAKSIAWAVEAARDPRVVYLDTETTGFGPRAEIVDIGVVGADGQVLFESLVRPERSIPREVIAIHGITDAHVRDAPRWDELYDHLAQVLKDRRILVYNVTFDRQMVNQSCQRYALPEAEADWECAMKRYAGFAGNWDARKRWFSFVKLEHAVRAFNGQPGGHRAAADAVACRAVVMGMAGTPPPDLITPEPLIPTAARRPWQTPRNESALTALGTLARWAHASREFRTLLEQIPVELREKPGAAGTWSPRQIVAHACGWEQEGARRLRLVAENPDLPDKTYDVDPFNAANVEIRQRQSWNATLDEFAKATHSLGLAAARLPHDARAREWLLNRTLDLEGHCDEMRQWLDEVAVAQIR